MNLKEFIKMNEGTVNEEQMPMFKDTQSAVNAINKYAPIVVQNKNPSGEAYGILKAALAKIGEDTAPEKYTREVHLGTSALRKMEAYKSKVSPRETPSRADVKGEQSSFGSVDTEGDGDAKADKKKACLNTEKKTKK